MDNPLLQEPRLDDSALLAPSADPSPPAPGMTIRGTVTATCVLLGLLVVSGAAGWSLTDIDDPLHPAPAPFALVAAAVAIVLVIVAAIRPSASPIAAPLYALAEGLVLGSVSRVYDVTSDGIVVQAVGGTVAVLVAMLALYALRVVRVTERFRMRVLSAGLGLLFFWFVTALLLAAGVTPTYWTSPGAAFVVSLVSVGIAAFYLCLDFDDIEEGAATGSPKHVEWQAALALVVTLVWIYLELLALMADDDFDD